MIKDQIRIHAHQSFEVKLDFPVMDFSSGTTDFGMDMFLFLPPALDTNKHNFTRHDFYRSLKSYIRLATPVYSFAEIADQDSVLNTRLYKSIIPAVAVFEKKTKNTPNILIKRYASIVNQGLSSEVKRLLLIKNREEQEEATSLFVQDCFKMRKWFTELTATIIDQSTNDDIKKTIRLADEYESLMLEGHLYVLSNGLTTKLTDGSQAIQSLHKLVLHEMKYRQKAKYPSVAFNHQSNEHVLHRKGRIKRYIESNLFLNTDTRKEGVFYEQLFFSLAAGVAMVFATTVAFASQQVFGNLTLPFFIALVISYMFKDRIKELTRLYFDRQRKKMLFDFRTTISIQKNILIGAMRESFRFERRDFLPPQIREARESMRVTKISEEWIGDKVIHYKTKISISSKKTRRLDDFQGLTQIFRFNISAFTMKMDDHEKEVFIKSKKKLKHQLINRVYHLNLIFRFTSGNEERYKYYKLITDKQGI
ncbi:MAG: hypothetical protein WC341_16270, partial [Bacteroidales bacterium]